MRTDIHLYGTALGILCFLYYYVCINDDDARAYATVFVLCVLSISDWRRPPSPPSRAQKGMRHRREHLRACARASVSCDDESVPDLCRMLFKRFLIMYIN